jgi:hypothetical protein
MTDDALLEMWKEQFSLLRHIALTAGVEPTAYTGSLPVALAFSEMLILCPTLDSANRCMQSDRAGAGLFLHDLSHVDILVREGQIAISPQPPGPSGPFYMICAAMLDVMRAIKESDPDGFESR